VNIRLVKIELAIVINVHVRNVVVDWSFCEPASIYSSYCAQYKFFSLISNIFVATMQRFTW